MYELSEEQVEEFREAFLLFDTENKGYIYTKEIGTVLRSLGINTLDEEKNNYINKYDSHGEGKINFDDFLEIILDKTNKTNTSEEILEALKLFDKDKNSILKIKNFKSQLINLFNDMDEEEANSICNYLKSNDYKDLDYIKIEDAVDVILSTMDLNKK